MGENTKQKLTRRGFLFTASLGALTTITAVNTIGGALFNESGTCPGKEAPADADELLRRKIKESERYYKQRPVFAATTGSISEVREA